MSNQFQLKGRVLGQTDGIVSLTYLNSEGTQIKDTVFLNKGQFLFSGFINEPGMASLRGNVKSIADDDPNAVGFFIEPGKMINVTVENNHFKEAKIIGSKTQTEYEGLLNQYSKIDNNSDSAYEKYTEMNYNFMKSHPNSVASVFLLSIYASRLPVDTIRSLYNNFNHELQISNYGKEVEKKIYKIDKNSPGKMSKEFTAQDINGGNMNLSDFLGKYVLLDFWASWCVPCRKGNPHLIQLFKKYHSDGLEIIGISDDIDMEAWKKAIEKDNIGIWYHVLNENQSTDAKEENSSISKLYGVQGLPTKILIDKDGVIIGRYLGSEQDLALDEKLVEIIKK